MDKRKWHAGTCRIGRVSSSAEPDFMYITLEDNALGLRTADIKIPLERFADFLTNRAVPVKFTATTTLLGSTRECKQEWVRVPKRFRHSPDGNELAKVCEPLEVDGWIADTNWSTRREEREENGKRSILVDFVRYVGEDGQPIILRG